MIITIAIPLEEPKIVFTIPCQLVAMKIHGLAELLLSEVISFSRLHVFIIGPFTFSSPCPRCPFIFVPFLCVLCSFAHFLHFFPQTLSLASSCTYLPSSPHSPALVKSAQDLKNNLMFRPSFYRWRIGAKRMKWLPKITSKVQERRRRAAECQTFSNSPHFKQSLSAAPNLLSSYIRNILPHIFGTLKWITISPPTHIFWK